MKRFFFSTLFAVAVFQTMGQLSDGMLLRYFLNGDAVDASENGYHGIVVNAIPALDRFGQPSKSLYFNGIDSYVEMPNLDDLKPELPITISYWINYDTLDPIKNIVFSTSLEENINTGVFMTASSSGNYGLGYGDGDSFYGVDSRRSLLSNAAIEVGVWHHITVVVRDAQDMEIWIDCINHGGSYSGTGGPLEYSPFPGIIGMHDQHTSFNAYHFQGYLDDFTYWNRDLSATEITMLCGKGHTEVGVNDIEGTEGVIVYPNPSEGVFYVLNGLNTGESALIYNSLGQIVYTGKLQNTLDLSHLDNGVYILVVEGSNNSMTQRIQIIH